MPTLSQLIEQKTKLDDAIECVRKTERNVAIMKIRDLMREHNITELPTLKVTTKVAPKWKDALTEKTWSGRGKTPKWFNEATAVRL